MTAFTALTRTQSKVFLREPLPVFFGLVFSALILAVIGTVFPGATEPNADLGGRSLVEIYAPVSIVLGLATVALTFLPATLGGDREKGILRRLSTTPAHPRILVAAHLVVQLAVVTIAAVATVLVGMLAFGIPFPESPGWFLISYALAALCLLGVGLLIGAVVPTAASGQAIGMLLYFPLLFFAGVYIPLEVMPEGVRTMSSYTPSGAAVQALSATWAGEAPQTSSLLVMAAFVVVVGSLIIWLFRWD
ncbi:MAG: ABC transporter permease [Actinomycetota bacterium]|nr:ABC transporter permease [Actinomycetota bacterium]